MVRCASGALGYNPRFEDQETVRASRKEGVDDAPAYTVINTPRAPWTSEPCRTHSNQHSPSTLPPPLNLPNFLFLLLFTPSTRPPADEARRSRLLHDHSADPRRRFTTSRRVQALFQCARAAVTPFIFRVKSREDTIMSKAVRHCYRYLKYPRDGPFQRAGPCISCTCLPLLGSRSSQLCFTRSAGMKPPHTDYNVSYARRAL